MTKEIPEAVIGGGFVVLRRNSVGRFRAPRCPYEHGSAESALAEAERMSMLNPGVEYLALQVVGKARVDGVA